MGCVLKMKMRMICSIIGVLIILMGPNGFSIIADAECTPDVTIPDNHIIQFSVEDGDDSYFVFSITDPKEFFPDGIYEGWCVQRSETLTRDISHSGMVYSSYDPDMPEFFKKDDGVEKWVKINYFLNHREDIFEYVDETLQCSVNRVDIQDAIWTLIGDMKYDDAGNCSQAIVDYLANDTRQTEIESFCPQLDDDILVVLIDTYQKEGYSIQKTIIEFPLTYYEPYNPPDDDSPSPVHHHSNTPPTADGSKNVPYVDRFNKSILFDGSKSYDYDGTIVEWSWSFGDRNNWTWGNRLSYI